MESTKKPALPAWIASGLALLIGCVYPTVFIRWIIPLYAVCILVMTAAAFLLFLALFEAKKKEKPLLRAVIGAAVYCAVLMAVTPLVNNGIFGAVAPWGSVLVNTALNVCFWLIMLRLIRKETGEPFVRRPLVCVLLVLAGMIVSVITTVPNIRATGFVVSDTVKNYQKRIDTIDIYENTLETALPQTQVYTLIDEHLRAPLPAGKTAKKVLVLGWDGCRADTMTMADTRTAVDMLLADGGKAYIAYCGGVNYPAPITQDTSTAPGWTTMFTGQWADVHGITGNGEQTATDSRTLLTTAIEDGLIRSSAFCFSWDGHLGTYANEIEYDKAHDLNVQWQFAENGDDGTFVNALADVQAPDGPDFIFTIFEYCDSLGHANGFWNDNPRYQEAFRLSNEKGAALIEAVKARETYETEDWLILITSDHGGYARGHGGETLMERMMFIVANKAF